ncbi:MAG: MFS transporter [Acetivibrio sp.]
MVLFFLGTILMNIAANLAHPVTPTLIKNLNLGDYMFGAAYGAMMFSNFLFSPFWGKRNEYRNSRNTIALCSVGYAVGQIFFAVSKTEGVILLARMFSGVFAGGIFVSLLTYVVHVSKEEDKGTNLTILAGLSSVAAAFGYFIGGMLGEISVEIVFGVQALALLFSGFFFLGACKKDAPSKSEKMKLKEIITTANPFMAFGQAKRFMNPRFFLLFSVCGMAYLGSTAFEQCFNYYIKDVFELTSGYNGTIKAAIGVVSLIANGTICLWIIRKTDIKKAAVGILFVASFLAFGVTFSKNPTVFIGISILLFAVNGICIPLTQELVSSQANREDSSIVMGFYNGIKSLGGVLGALLAGFLYTFHKLSPIWFGGAAFVMAALIGIRYINLCRGKKKERTL